MGLKKFIQTSVTHALENLKNPFDIIAMYWLLSLILIFTAEAKQSRAAEVPVNSTEYLHIRYLVDRKLMPDGKLNLLYPHYKMSRLKSALLAYNFIRHAVEDRGYVLRPQWWGVRPEYLDVHKIHFLKGRLMFLLDKGVFAETGWQKFEPQKFLNRYEMIRLGYEILRALEGIPHIELNPRAIKIKRLFKDVPHWHYAAPMLVAFNSLGIVQKNWGENFEGNEEVDRFEIAKFMVGIIKLMKSLPPESINQKKASHD